MNISFNKIASIIAFIIGGMAIFAGGKVLLGNDPGYYVINWLPVYNYTIGILTVFLTAPLIWTKTDLPKSAAVSTFSLHAAVMLVLQTTYGGVVAPDSIQAMTTQINVWVIILGLMFFRSRKPNVAA